MTIPLVDLTAQYRGIKDEVDLVVSQVLSSGRFILGPEVEAFEEEFAAYCEADHAVGMSSGTAALQLALEACGVGPGDEVITTVFTFIATAAAISHVGAQPVFVDIDQDTYNIDPALVESAITAKTKAIIPVHLFGQPADMRSIGRIARTHGLRVIEDAAQAHGATYEGKCVGGLGDVACFSFYPAKNLGAYGDAGALVTNDRDIADRVRSVSNHGRSGWYEHEELGYTYRLDALQAAILRVKLAHLGDWNASRRRIARRYTEALSGTNLVLPQELPSARSVYHLYVVRSQRRDELVEYLGEEGIEAKVHYPMPLHLQPAYAQLGGTRGQFPVAEKCAREVLSLPTYPELSGEQVDEIAGVIHAFEASG